MKFFGWLIVIGIALYLFNKAKIKAAVSAGNPNYPASQPVSMIGPQGPNDGSNNYSSSGHTVTPDGTTGPIQSMIARGFRYVSGGSERYGVRQEYSAY